MTHDSDRSVSLDTARLATLADVFRDLHQPGNPLLLVNVWDAETARRVVSAGGLAVATSSAAVAASRGVRDDNTARTVAFEALATVAAAVPVPVTADLEGGYGLSGSQLVEVLLGAGAVGCNIEDTDHSIGDRLLAADRHAAYIAEVREGADAAGVPVVINARIDTIVRSPGRDPGPVLDETIRRARLYLDAGADCVYPIGLRDPSFVKQIVAAVGGAVNVNPSAPLEALAGAGAARVSFGAGAFAFVMADFDRRASAVLAGDAAAFAAG